MYLMCLKWITNFNIIDFTCIDDCKCSPVKYFFCFTQDSHTVDSDASTGGTSIIAFQLLSVRSKVVASVTPATLLFDRDALTAHLCFNRSYILSCILVVQGSVFWWVSGSFRLAQTETNKLSMWKVGAVWEIQWLYSALMAYIQFRLWTRLKLFKWWSLYFKYFQLCASAANC